MILLLLGVLLLTLYFLRKKYLYDIRKQIECAEKIPGPTPLPIFGSALEFGFTTKSFFRYLKYVTKEYGPVVCAWIGPKLGILIADPPTIELLLGNSKNMNKSSLYQVSEPWLGEGLLMSKVEIWKKHRKIIAPAFQGHILSTFIPVFNSNLDVLIEKLSDHENGPDFDIYPYFSLFALDVICETAMGVKVNAQIQSESDYVKAVNRMESVVVLRSMKPWLLPNIFFRLSSLGRLQSENLPVILNLTKQVIRERTEKRCAESNLMDKKSQEDDENRGSMRKAFLDYLLDYIQRGEQLTNTELEDEVNNILFAGHVTTAISLGFTCWLLAKHPHIQQKTVEELEAIFGDSNRPCTAQDLTQLKYLEQVIKESLRILPPVGAFARKLSEDIKTDKYVFPAGSEVGVSVYMLHRHPDYFPEPERFDPDRFSPENSLGRHPYCYLPFGGGQRICLGYKYAVLEMKTAMAQILRRFKLLPSENPFQDLDLTAQVTMKPRNGVKIRLVPRQTQK